MIKKIFLFSLSLFLFIGFPMFVFAGSPPPTTIQNPITATDFTILLTSIIGWVQNIAVLIAVLMIIYSGFLFMTAGGEEEKITKAKKTLIWSLVGLAILIMGENFITLIKNILSVK